MEKRFYTERELAGLLRRSVHTLRRDRFEGKGVPYIKLGAMIRYPSDKVEQYLEEHLIEPSE